MGKASRTMETNQSSITEISPDSAAPTAGADFSNGELGQLQEILYGAQKRATNDQISTLQKQINEQIQTMTNMLNSRLNQLTESIDKTSKAHEKKLNELQAEQRETAKSISQSMEDKNLALASSISLLGKSTGEEAARVHSELKTVESQLQSQLRETHDSLQLNMAESVDQLQSKKLDRQNLAQILGEVSQQLASSGPSASK